MHIESDRLKFFQSQRPRLISIAYRILGSRADAEDVVQDSLIKWLEAGAAADKPAAWLTTVVTRRAIDVLRSAHRSRVDYVGQWLPEPTLTDVNAESEDAVELASSLSTAFLLILERLSPKERAAFLLREIFDMSYGEVAEAIDLREDACRKLVSRAKSGIASKKTRYCPPVERQRELLNVFLNAIDMGTPSELAKLLAEDVSLRADGGGKAAAIKEVLQGADVIRFIVEKLHIWWLDFSIQIAELNGALGLILHEGDKVVAAVTFNYELSGQIVDIQVMRNPEKLESLALAITH